MFLNIFEEFKTAPIGTLGAICGIASLAVPQLVSGSSVGSLTPISAQAHHYTIIMLILQCAAVQYMGAFFTAMAMRARPYAGVAFYMMLTPVSALLCNSILLSVYSSDRGLVEKEWMIQLLIALLLVAVFHLFLVDSYNADTASEKSKAFFLEEGGGPGIVITSIIVLPIAFITLFIITDKLRFDAWMDVPEVASTQLEEYGK